VLMHPGPLLSAGNVRINEGHTGTTQFAISITLDVNSQQTITVNWHTADNSATSPVDYVSASGVATFLPGQTQQTVYIDVNGDTLAELNERFEVVLEQPVNAGIDKGTGVATIVND